MLCAQAGLSVQYTLDANDLQHFAITFIALACACAVFAVLRSWSWAKCSTSNGMGVVVVLKFVASSAAALSNLWLLLAADLSIWNYCFYKVCSCFYSCLICICFTCNTLAALPSGPRLVLAFRSQGQSNLYLVYPQLSIDCIISGFFYAAFGIADQPPPAAAAGDEQQPLQPPQKKKDVTFWRTAAANEWNELCSYRKSNVVCIIIMSARLLSPHIKRVIRL